ncbi:hypothetical protein U879_18945 [Defluviimonas sp. 20V17]|nr:hypothetical protein U879_18945 [Defluviimonas sp. 20V17]
MAERVSALMEDRLRVRGRDVPAKLRRGGRRLPRKLRREAAMLADAADWARNPKLLPRLDAPRLARAHDALTRHLSHLGRGERRRDALRGIATSVVLSLLLVAALFTATLIWRGFL